MKQKNIIFNNLFLDKWIDYKFDISKSVITEIIIRKALEKFYEDILSKLTDNHIILINFKVQINKSESNSSIFRTLSYLQTLTKKDFNDLVDIFIEFWNLRSEDYLTEQISNIVFVYKIMPLDSEIKKTKLSRAKVFKKDDKNKFKFHGFNLPNTMDYTKWGKVISSNDNFVLVQRDNGKTFYHITIYDKYIVVKIIFKDKILLEFKDTVNNTGNLDSFTRNIKNQEYVFKDGILKVKKILRKCKKLSKIKKVSFYNDNFLTMDLETRTIENKMIPYCVSIFDGKNKKSFYLSDFNNNSEELLLKSLKFLMKRRFHQYKIYLHNFSYFDGVFLLKTLALLSDNIRPTIKDGKFIDIKVTFPESNYYINFRDSLLLLPSSLDKLSLNFNVENKTIFPYAFVNNNFIDLNYEGPVPEYEYFDKKKVSLEKYNEYKNSFINNNKNWNLKIETIKYCEQDVVTLYQILSNFQKNVYNKFRLDVIKYPTLSSLSFAIYRSSFQGDSHIPLIDGEMFRDLKKGYTGGSVDVFIPYGEDIRGYDVSSLYPYVMKYFPMPVGNPTFFEGDILFDGLFTDNKPFGFFEVEVTAPEGLKIPILQTRFKGENGSRTITPLGSWTGTYFSEEIYNAMELGYKFKILRGYLFEKEYIFKEFVDTLYILKANSEKGSPDYIVSKLLLNSLYGRFGMNPEMENHLILSKENAIKYYDKYEITDVVDLKNGKEIVSFFDNIESQDNNNKVLNISIAISAAVTACGRIHMSKFKTMKGINIYYSDTDSIFTNKELDQSFIGNDLGKMKLEHHFKKAVFLAPKVYGGVDFNNKEYVKVKGLKNPINFNELLDLLNKDSKLEINQEKWHRNISKGEININKEIYTLMITDNKRKLVYDSNNNFIDTLPYIFTNNTLS